MKNYKVVDKYSFLSKKKLVNEFVELENGAGLYIQEMSGAGVESLAEKAKEKQLSNVESMASIIALSACDEDGNLMFDIEDVPAIIENNSISTLVKLSDVAVRISKLTSKAVSEAKNNLKNV